MTKSGVSAKEWFANVFGIKQKSFFYLIVLLLLGFYAALGFITGSFTLSMPLYFLLLFSITNIVAGGLEEAGWMYILQPNLEKSMPFTLATLLKNVVWVLWHLPLFFMDGMVQQNMNFGIYFIFMLGYSFSLAAIRRVTKSVWLCVLFHASLNAVLTVFAVELNLFATSFTTLAMISISLLLVRGIPHHASRK